MATALCPSGRCGVQPVRIVGSARHCGACMASMGEALSLTGEEARYAVGAGLTLEEMARRKAEFSDWAKTAHGAAWTNPAPLADPPLPAKQRPLMDIINELHLLSHELAERLVKS